MDVKFISQDNEVQKLYAKFGMVVPVGDLSTGKAPAIQPLPSTSTQTSVTFSFNVMSGADITAIEYKVNDGEAVSVTPQKGVVTVELSGLEYNSGPYEIELTVTNETGDTSVTQTADLVPYTNWATPDEVLAGNRYIGEDGEAHVGEIVTKDSTDLTVNERTVTVPAGYYAENASASVSSDYIIPTGSTTITNNGTDINIAQYATVDVAVPASAVVSGTLPITANGTGIDVTNYAAVDVDVPTGLSNYLELQLGDPSPWEDSWQNKYPFGGYLTLNLNDLTIPEGGTYSGNTPQAWVADMEFLQCYLDEQHSDFFMVDCTSYNGMLNAPRSLGNAFITSDGTVIIPCIGGSYDPDPDTGEQTIPNYDNIPCDQTDLTGDFEVYAVTSLDAAMTPMYEVVATGTYFIPATQVCE